MRTTLDIADDVLIEAKRLAASSGRTLRAVVEDALREVLARAAEFPHEDPPELPVSGKGGVRPGVDLDDSAGLLDIMEGTD